MDCEKRRYPRARYDCEILYPFIIKDGQSHCYNQGLYHLHTLDISEAGICLQSNFLISQEDFVSFYLRIGNNLPFKALVKVRWNRISNASYVCGGEFIALSLSDIYIIREYMQSQDILTALK